MNDPVHGRARIQDEVVADLDKIIADSRTYSDKGTFDINKDKLMMKLCSYIVRRDHKVFKHGYDQGQAKFLEDNGDAIGKM